MERNIEILNMVNYLETRGKRVVDIRNGMIRYESSMTSLLTGEKTVFEDSVPASWDAIEVVW